MDEEEIKKALSSLKAAEKEYKKGAVIMHAGSVTERMGLVIEGSVTIESNDIWGNRAVLSHVGRGQLFAETYALLKNEPMMIDAVANENCRILFLRTGSIYVQNNDTEFWRYKLTLNLLAISSQKNLLLSSRSLYTSPKTIRGRIMTYLNSASLKKNSKEFDIPFDRQQLADYLNVERTALSKELGKMKHDGIITFRKNHFIIL